MLALGTVRFYGYSGEGGGAMFGEGESFQNHWKWRVRFSNAVELFFLGGGINFKKVVSTLVTPFCTGILN